MFGFKIWFENLGRQNFPEIEDNTDFFHLMTALGKTLSQISDKRALIEFGYHCAKLAETPSSKHMNEVIKQWLDDPKSVSRETLNALTSNGPDQNSIVASYAVKLAILEKDSRIKAAPWIRMAAEKALLFLHDSHLSVDTMKDFVQHATALAHTNTNPHIKSNIQPEDIQSLAVMLDEIEELEQEHNATNRLIIQKNGKLYLNLYRDDLKTQQVSGIDNMDLAKNIMQSKYKNFYLQTIRNLYSKL